MFRQIKRKTGNYLVKGSSHSTLQLSTSSFVVISCLIFVKYAINSTQNGEKNVLKVYSMMILQL